MSNYKKSLKQVKENVLMGIKRLSNYTKSGSKTDGNTSKLWGQELDDRQMHLSAFSREALEFRDDDTDFQKHDAVLMNEAIAKKYNRKSR